jgi:hypothetical protein
MKQFSNYNHLTPLSHSSGVMVFLLQHMLIVMMLDQRDFKVILDLMIVLLSTEWIVTVLLLDIKAKT